GIGDIFVGRVAGNFENVDMLGSMEFGTAVAGSKLIVVLGHTSCGAVKGTIDQAKLGNLTPTLANIEPAVMASMSGMGERASSNDALVRRVTEENVRKTVRDITARSPVLAERVASGQLMVVGGVYDLASGRVTWLDM
ncbi:MAG: carbonic anhydrase, partial [Planctomycetota bacterium]